MLKYYLKLAVRNLWKQKGVSLTNVLGLATSMAACLLLLQYIGYELSFDSFHGQADRIYRVVNERYQNGDLVQRGTITYPTIGRAMKQDYPEIERATRLYPLGTTIVTNGRDIYQMDETYAVDADFLNVFDFPVLAMANDSVLALNLQVVLQRSQAEQWFDVKEGEYEKLLGQPLQTDQGDNPFTIVGVIEDIPVNSFLQPDLLISYQTLIQSWGEGVDNSWGWSDFYHYLVLQPDTDVAALEAKFVDFSERYFKGAEVSGSDEVFYLQPLRDAHLYSTDLEYEHGVTANGRVVWSLLIIAFFILIIAWVNYTNLSSARALERAKTVGVQRIVGAQRRQLIMQFLTEAAVVNTMGFVLAMMLAVLLRPLFWQVMDIPAAIPSTLATLSEFPTVWIAVLGLIVSGLSLSAIYPAWLLSGQRMVSALKGSFRSGRKGQSLRQGLIVFQFTASVALIAATLLVGKQLRYLQERDLGLNIDQVLVVSPPRMAQWDSTFITRTEAFKRELVQLPGVEVAATANRTPGQGTGRFFEVQRLGQPDDRNFTFRFMQADYNYADVFDLEVKAGRFLQLEDHSFIWEDLRNIVINETAVKKMGLTENEQAVGEVLDIAGRQWTIVGVVADFHQLSLHHSIEPFLLRPAYSTYNPILARVKPGDLSNTIAEIEAVYSDFYPGNIFTYSFADDRFAQEYAADQRFNRLLSGFTLLAIIIACLGLSGLAFYAAYLRTKEIGIRKVLGAAPGQLLLLLTKDFMLLIGVAILLGLPLAWWGVQQWLVNFAYQAEISWGTLGGAAIVALLIAFLTVGIHALGKIFANPIESLRHE